MATQSCTSKAAATEPQPLTACQGVHVLPLSFPTMLSVEPSVRYSSGKRWLHSAARQDDVLIWHVRWRLA